MCCSCVTFHICPKWPYRVPDNVVVHLLGAVESNDAKHHENHGSCVHQAATHYTGYPSVDTDQDSDPYELWEGEPWDLADFRLKELCHL